jgi:hypothetical protein
MDPRTLHTLISETAARASQKTPVPLLRPGTVTSSTGPRVLVDGDTVAVEVPSLCGPLAPSQRVMVEFYPPSGAAVIGCLGGQKVAATVLSCTAFSAAHAATSPPVTFTVAEYDPFAWWDGATNVVVAVAGMYRVAITADWQSAADYTRALVGPYVNGANIPIPTNRGDASFAIAAAYVPRSINSASTPIRLAVGDTVAAQVHQTNTATAARTVAVRMSVEWLGP